LRGDGELCVSQLLDAHPVKFRAVIIADREGRGMEGGGKLGDSEHWLAGCLAWALQG